MFEMNQYGRERHDPRDFSGDLGCGSVLLMRSSPLAMIVRYDADLRARHCDRAKRHEFHHLTLPTEGCWQFHGKDGRTVLDSKTLMVGAFDDEYGCRHYPDVVTNCLEVQFQPGTIDRDCEPLFLKQVVPAGSARSLIERALQAPDDDCFDSLLFILLDYASNCSNGLAKQRPSKLRTQRAKRFIELHASEPISLADIASELGVSRFTCVRQFRAQTGITPYGYLLQVRMERAKHLLEHTRLAIDDIGAHVGFRQLPHFSRSFKRCTSYAPSEYRAARAQ